MYPYRFPGVSRRVNILTRGLVAHGSVCHKPQILHGCYSGVGAYLGTYKVPCLLSCAAENIQAASNGTMAVRAAASPPEAFTSSQQ